MMLLGMDTAMARSTMIGTMMDMMMSIMMDTMAITMIEMMMEMVMDHQLMIVVNHRTGKMIEMTMFCMNKSFKQIFLC